MEILQGIPASAGYVIGEAFVVEREETLVPDRFIDLQDHSLRHLRKGRLAGEVEWDKEMVEREVERFLNAVSTLEDAIEDQSRRLTEEGEESLGAVFDTYKLILTDRLLQQEVTRRIRFHRFTAEYAIDRAFRKYIKRLRSLGDEFFSHRSLDFQDIERRLIFILRGRKQQDLSHLEKEVVLVGHDIPPSRVASLDREHVLGFAADVGGMTSHTAIVARDLGIPAVVGLKTVSTDLSPGDIIILDGHTGRVIISPDEGTLRRYERFMRKEEGTRSLLVKEAREPAVTKDGARVHVCCNIEFPEEVRSAREHGAEGIGLFRTEFLYLRSESVPNEREHLAAYREVLRSLGDRPLVIRTFDLGADKLDGGRERERNPMLGTRSIRLAMRKPDVFKTQIRAILRAGAEGNVKCMLPLITTTEEVDWAREVIEEAKSELEREGEPYDAGVSFGIMIEVPAVALMADVFAPKVDFFSLGTNDLIQYALAVDRSNEQVAGLFSPSSPAVLRLIKMTVEAAERNGIDVSMCGEMAGDGTFTETLLGLGLRSFSVAPVAVPTVKRMVRLTAIDEAREVATEALKCSDAAEVAAFLASRVRELLREA